MIEQHETLPAAAAAFATRAHAGQKRTGTQFPYVTHPLGVGHLLRSYYPGREDLEAAGYLHDVVEDTLVTVDELDQRFGPDVASLVDAVTRRPGWTLKLTNADVARLKAADVIDNARDTVRGVDKGHDVWSRFSAGRGKVKYWRMIVNEAWVIRDEPIWRELDRVVDLAEERAATPEQDLDFVVRTYHKKFHSGVPFDSCKIERCVRLRDAASRYQESVELRALFDLQSTRLERARTEWQAATGRTDVWPDLGRLLDWLLDRRVPETET